MTASRGPDERVVFPRWRRWRTSEQERELGSLRLSPSTLDQTTTGEELTRELLDRLSDFEQWGGKHFAADVVGTAIVLGLESHDSVRQAATELLDAASPSARALAKRVLSGVHSSGGQELPYVEIDREGLRPWLAKQKEIVRAQPRNVLAWADLALAQTVLGQAHAAERAIRIALAQANGNRFVLRSAARFYIHREDFERAHDVLTGDMDRLRADPWLLASEIAIADSAGRPQRYASHGRRLLDEGFAPHDVSELASALATIELKHGKVKQARRLLSKALVDPTDNALAQAEWSVPRGISIVDANQFNLPRNYEAKARYHYRNEQFEEALKFGERWQADQPFALDPAWFTSFVASALVDDQQSAIRACRIGLIASPRDPLLLNNLAFSLASSGRSKEARELLQGTMGEVSGVDRAVLMATRGLIAFRSDDAEGGRRMYGQAVDALVKEKELTAAVIAAVYWIYEELRADGRGLSLAVKRAESISQGVARSPDLELARRRVERLIRQIESKLGSNYRVIDWPLPLISPGIE
jgi:tetratricopeptide (TPR) repeat protein